MIEKIAPYNVELQQWLIAAMLVGLIVVVLLSVVLFMLYFWNTARIAYERYEHKRNEQIKKEKGESWIKFLARVINNFLTQDNLSILAGSVLFIMIAAILFFCVILFIHAINAADWPTLTLKRFGMLGDFFGGFIGTLIAAIVAIYAIRTYKAEREYQKEDAVSDKLSTMLELHKQNVNEIKIGFIDEKGNADTKKGREAFALMYEELNKIYDVVFEAIKSIVDNNPEEYGKWSEEINKKKLAHVISFGYFFYDVESYVLTGEAGSILFILSERVRGLVKQSINGNLKNLQRHNILGHYFRHLYNMVSYIDANGFTGDYDKKAFYVKLIRSQLSDYEQILLYYNSLSTLGADWNKPKSNDEEKIENMSLICKYRLLKNCPSYIDYFGYTPSEMYEKEINTWLTEKNELFFETDFQGQLNVLNEIIARN